MNRHARFSPLLVALALGSSCQGTEGNVFLGKNGDSGSNQSCQANCDGSVQPDSGPPSDAQIDDRGSLLDGSVETDAALDGSVDNDGGDLDAGEDDASFLPDASENDGGFADGGVDAGQPLIDCSQNPPVFPSFDRSCGTASDCAIGTVQTNCCGTLTVTGINSSEARRFSDAAAICASQFPGCGCPTLPTFADDGTTEANSGPAIVQCISNTCQTTFPTDPTACGGNLSCDPFTTICVAMSPIGPAIQYSCEPIPAGCEQNRTCSCAAGSICNPPFTACLDSGPNQISCECLLCQ